MTHRGGVTRSLSGGDSKVVPPHLPVGPPLQRENDLDAPKDWFKIPGNLAKVNTKKDGDIPSNERSHTMSLHLAFLKSSFNSWVPIRDTTDRRNLHLSEMGGYRFPFLDVLGGGLPYNIRTLTIPPVASTKDREIKAIYRAVLAEMTDLVTDPKTVYAYVDGNKLTIVRAGFTLSDMGISVNTTADGAGKAFKRLKTLNRPFRIWASRPQINVQVVEGGSELDGALVVSSALYAEAMANVELPGFHPVTANRLKGKLARVRTHNGRIIGPLVNAETGESIDGCLKGQFFIADLPDGIDVITTTANIKHELTGGHTAVVGFEPQTAKDGYEDQQTIVNQSFFVSNDEARDRMTEAFGEIITALDTGTALSSFDRMLEEEFADDYAANGMTVAKVTRWNAASWAIHGLDYRWSPFLVRQLGLTRGRKFATVDNTEIAEIDPDEAFSPMPIEKRLRIPIPGGIRAQMVSQALMRLCGRNYAIADGHITWDSYYGVKVVNDNDWVNKVIPTHGGCDLDDFFLGRMGSDSTKVIETRSPNNRGEWTEWTVDRTWPGFEEGRPTTLKRRPTQILDALASGKVTYKSLPSQANSERDNNTHALTPQDVIRAMSAQANTVGSYGQYELAVRAWNSGHTTKLMKAQLPSEKCIDAFITGEFADQAVITDETEKILDEIENTGIKIDPTLALRLPSRDTRTKPARLRVWQTNEKSRLTGLIGIQTKAYDSFVADLESMAIHMGMPSFLAKLGPTHIEMATRKLRALRREIWEQDQADRQGGFNAPQRLARQRFLIEGFIGEVLEAIPTDAQRHEFIISFWYACLTVPTAGGKTTDQPIMGTDLFNHLVAALVYFGIGKVPVVDEMSDDFVAPIHYNHGYDTFDLTCVICGTTYTTAQVATVHAFHTNEGVCKACSA